MKNDEALTYISFLDGSWGNVFWYPYPNNHVFHTILAKGFVEIFGNYPQVIRLTALLGGIFSIILLFLIGKLLNQKNGAYLSPLFAAISPYFIYYSTNARGYTLICTFVAAIMLIILEAEDDKEKIYNSHRVFLISLFMAFGLFTIPSMAYPIFGITLWLAVSLLINGHKLLKVILRLLLPLTLTTTFITINLYIPVILSSGGLRAITQNEFVTPDNINKFYSKLPQWINSVFYYSFTRDLSLDLLIISSVFFILSLFVMIKSRNRLILLLPILILGSMILVFLNQKSPPIRTLIFLVPVVYIYLDIGFSFLLERLMLKWRVTAISVISILGVLFTLSITKSYVVNAYPDTGIRYNFIADFVEETSTLIYKTEEKKSIILFAVNPSQEYSIEYYLLQNNIEYRHPAWKEAPNYIFLHDEQFEKMTFRNIDLSNYTEIYYDYSIHLYKRINTN